MRFFLFSKVSHKWFKIKLNISFVALEIKVAGIVNISVFSVHKYWLGRSKESQIRHSVLRRKLKSSDDSFLFFLF